MKINNTRKALLGSVLATLIALIMLIGTTFAWFTDTAGSKGNIIQAGNLKVDLLYSSDDVNDNYVSVKENNDPIFSYQHWEPGYTDVKYIKIVNGGTLAFKYELDIVPTDAVGDLAEVIDVYYFTPADGGTMPNIGTSFDPVSLEAYKLGTLAEVIAAAGINAPVRGILLPEASLQAPNVAMPEDTDATRRGFTKALIVLHMQETAGNEYQDATIGGNFDIQLSATQVEYEEDSFDHKYDAEAKFPVKPNAPVVLNTVPEYNYGGIILGGATPINNNLGIYIAPSGYYKGDFVLKTNVKASQLGILDVVADVDNFIVLEAQNTIFIANCDITLPVGGKLATTTDSYSQLLFQAGTVKVNGVVITKANISSYVTGFNSWDILTFTTIETKLLP